MEARLAGTAQQADAPARGLAEQLAGSRNAVARWLSVGTGVVALVVLIGWISGIEALRSFLPGAVQMKANTAICLLLLASALYLHSLRPAFRGRAIAMAVAALAAAIGAATLCEYAFGWKLGIDELLFLDSAKAFNARPGRMSPYSAVAFIANGAAFAGLLWPRQRWLLRLGTIISGAIGAASVLGYCWNASEITTDQIVPPVAVNSAVALLFVSIGSLLLDQRRNASSRGEPTEGGGIETKVLAAFIAALALLYLAGGITYRMGVSFSNSAKWVTYTQDVRAELGQLDGSMSDAETAARNYQLTAEPAFKTDYDQLVSDVDGHLEALRGLLDGDPEQLARLVDLTSAINARLQILAQRVGGATPSPADMVRSAGAVNDRINAMKLIRDLIRHMDGIEAQLLTTRTAQLARQRSSTLAALIATLAIATATLILLFRSIMRDIRDRARIAWELKQAQREAQRATLAKSEFLAAMSHEIRTPMNGVIGMVDVLLQSSLTSSQIEMANLIGESADSLLTIIDDILDFSKIEAGRLDIEDAPMSIATLVEKTCGLLNRLAEGNGGTLTVFVDPAIPAAVLGDAARLRQVLVNLASNAIKFSSGLQRRGLVSVRAMLAKTESGRVWLDFQVTDNGIGMDDAALAKAFISFTQADASTTRKYGGTGLGLTISRQLARLMGGDITVQSIVGQGSTFTVRLPFVPTSEPAEAPEKMPDIKGISCLVIGGLTGMADDLAAYLSADAAQVSRVLDLDAAHDWARTRFSGLTVWVLDPGENMPVLAELYARIRARSNADSRVALVVVGRGRRRNPRAEADGLIIIDGNALKRRTLAKAVAIAAGRAADEPEELSGKRHAITPSPPPREQAIRQRSLILVAEDNVINQKVIRHQLHLLGYAADVVPSGSAALTRWRSGDYALLLTDLHMPEMDGYDLALTIRHEETGQPRMPIIALTANALKGESDRCRSVGMDDFLSKPAGQEELAAMLERWLPHQESPRLAAAAAPMDLSVLTTLLGDDPVLIHEVLRDFVASTESMAAELSAACGTGRAADAVAIAHKLKSSARTVGALRLGDLCAAIEAAGAAADGAQLSTLRPQFEAEMAALDGCLRSMLAQRQQVSPVEVP